MHECAFQRSQWGCEFLFFINLKWVFANLNLWTRLRARMLATPRVLITLLAALWLPVCHCQLSMFLFDNVACHDGAQKSSAGVHNSAENCCRKVRASGLRGKSKKTGERGAQRELRHVAAIHILQPQSIFLLTRPGRNLSIEERFNCHVAT